MEKLDFSWALKVLLYSLVLRNSNLSGLLNWFPPQKIWLGRSSHVGLFRAVWSMAATFQSVSKIYSFLCLSWYHTKEYACILNIYIYIYIKSFYSLYKSTSDDFLLFLAFWISCHQSSQNNNQNKMTCALKKALFLLEAWCQGHRS